MIDRIIHNANIILDTFGNRASAIAIYQDQIIAVGSDDEILTLKGQDTVVDNLEGYTIIPGLTDSHVHLQWLTQSLHSVDVFEAPSKQEIIRRVTAYADSVEAGEWIVGRGWTQEVWDNPHFPTAGDLDLATTDHPVFLIAKSGHGGWLNSLGLERMGIRADTPDPEGGEMVRDENGNPTGMLFETAVWQVKDALPPTTAPQLSQQFRATQEALLASGIVAVHDFDNPLVFDALQLLAEDDALDIRVLKHVNKDWIQHAIALGIHSGFGNAYLRFGNLKLFADGALGQRTAYMIEPYEGEPDNYGMVVVDKEEIQELVLQATQHGISSTVHAIGDRAVHDVLDVYAVARKLEQRENISSMRRRHRIEHVQLIHPDDAHRLAELDVIASMQPIHATADAIASDAYWGVRSQWGYNPRLQIDHGARVIFGSDAPVESFDPIRGIHAAVTRQRADGSLGTGGWYPQNKVTIEEALQAYTHAPAYAEYQEEYRGVLHPGYLADCVALSQNIFEIPPNQILETQVLGTMVGGRWKYRNF